MALESYALLDSVIGSAQQTTSSADALSRPMQGSDTLPTQSGLSQLSKPLECDDNPTNVDGNQEHGQPQSSLWCTVDPQTATLASSSSADQVNQLLSPMSRQFDTTQPLMSGGPFDVHDMGPDLVSLLFPFGDPFNYPMELMPSLEGDSLNDSPPASSLQLSQDRTTPVSNGTGDGASGVYIDELDMTSFLDTGANFGRQPR
jgi:hypothetical protein